MDNDESALQDLFGQDLNAGDYVLGAHGHDLAVYRVLRMTPKMVRVVRVDARTRLALKGKLRYSNELFKIAETLVTFYLMKHK